MVAGVFIHGFNGIRIGLTSLGVSVPRQKQMFYVLMGIALIVIVYFAIRMIAHA